MKKTPLNDIHKKLGAKMIDFGGWEMPVQYSSIIEEHEAVRNRCGLFDVSHMGEISFKGKSALDSLQKLVTNDVARLKTGQILYTPMCYDNGGIVDDVLVYCLDQEDFLMVVNASNTKKDYEWVTKNVSGEVMVENVSDNYAQLALQGPEAKNILKPLTDINLDILEYYWFERGKVAGKEVILSRTGYTGELGYEIYLSPIDSLDCWNKIMENGKKYGLLPAGLGARDTLRLEKKYCLYGNDIDETKHPLEAGLSWTVKFSKDHFIGYETLLEYKEEGYQDRLVGFKLIERGIPRHGYKIEAQGEEVGVVTSGSYSPSLKENIGLGYIRKDKAKVGAEIAVIIRGKAIKGEIVETPFI